MLSMRGVLVGMTAMDGFIRRAAPCTAPFVKWPAVMLGDSTHEIVTDDELGKFVRTHLGCGSSVTSSEEVEMGTFGLKRFCLKETNQSGFYFNNKTKYNILGCRNFL